MLAGVAVVCDVKRALCVNESGQQRQPQDHLRLQYLLISGLFWYRNACLMFVEEEELFSKRASTPHVVHFKGSICGLRVQP